MWFDEVGGDVHVGFDLVVVEVYGYVFVVFVEVDEVVCVVCVVVDDGDVVV